MKTMSSRALLIMLLLMVSLAVVCGAAAAYFVSQVSERHEREEIRAQCKAQVLAVRDEFKSRADERDSVAAIATAQSEASLQLQREILDLLRKRAPVTDRIAQRVQSIDSKATSAAAEAKAAKLAAARAARAAEADAPVPAHSAAAINDSVRAVNHGTK
ncbi:hypothetical protein [Chitinasiproducens palmae]|uniref:Uncharacterized protein n=1 Tax=Chitinasiproducens palmae TaxID=1770053 RepID=A0A1H2PQS3_9BURK|nr:hypothetical protein [Chitinasiproducens palmae]SDV49179.1 hypothetical protein SAMN05216551_107131 [Chitinasiproducens palmae]